jgi:hypothetical protein
MRTHSKENDMRITALFAVPLVAACACVAPPQKVETPQRVETPQEEVSRASLKHYIGQPFTAYLNGTLETPHSMYDTTADGHRHFLFGDSLLVTHPGYGESRVRLSPSVGPIVCSRTVETRRVSAEHSSDAFQIVAIRTVFC